MADSRAVEGRGAAADFRVTLGRPAAGPVTVDYATADRTARAGSGYSAMRGTLAFAPGETAKTVSVPVLDGAVDEGSESFVLHLSNAGGARIADGDAVGTIANSDPIPKAWIARFGRTVAEQAVDAVSERLLSEPPKGAGRMTVGGRTFEVSSSGNIDHGLGTGSAGSLSGLRDGAAGPHAPVRGILPARDLLPGSAFLRSGGESAAGRPAWSAWGRFTTGGFDGTAPGATGTVQLDGRVKTGTVGIDAAWTRWLVGMVLSVSDGAGSWGMPGAGRGRIDSSLTGVWPYLRYDPNDRIRTWGLIGYGAGGLTIARADGTAPAVRTDLDMRLAAAGLRGALLEPGDSAGFDLALRADAFLVQIASAAVPDMAAALCRSRIPAGGRSAGPGAARPRG